MSTRTITGHIYNLQEEAWTEGESVRFVLEKGKFTSTHHTPPATTPATIDEDGAISVELHTPARYRVILPNNYSFVIVVPEGAATTLEALHASTDATLPPSNDLQTAIDAALLALALDALADVNAPSPADGQVLTWDEDTERWVAAAGGGDLSNYYTKAETDALVAGLDGQIDAVALAVSSHVANTSNPHNTTAAQVGASAVGHTHDDRYYTEAEIGSLLAGYAALSGATFSGAIYVPLGGASVLGIAADRGMGSGGSTYVHLTGGGGLLNLSGAQVGMGNSLRLGWGVIHTGASAGEVTTYFARTADGQVYLAGAASGSQTRFALHVDSDSTDDRLAAYLGADWTTPDDATRTSRLRLYGVLSAVEMELARLDPNCAAGETALWLYDKDKNALLRVTAGAADSGGSGYRALRIIN